MNGDLFYIDINLNRNIIRKILLDMVENGELFME